MSEHSEQPTEDPQAPIAEQRLHMHVAPPEQVINLVRPRRTLTTPNGSP